VNNRYLPLVLLLTMSGCAFDLGALRGTGVLEDAGGLVGDGSILVDAGLEGDAGLAGDAGPPTCCRTASTVVDLSAPPCCEGLISVGGTCQPGGGGMEGQPCAIGHCAVGFICEADVCHADPAHVVLPECGT